MKEKFDLLQYMEEGMNEVLAESTYKNFTVHLRMELDDGPENEHPVPVLVYEIRCRDMVYVKKEYLYTLIRGDDDCNNYNCDKVKASVPGIMIVAKIAENFFKEELMKKFLGEAEE